MGNVSVDRTPIKNPLPDGTVQPGVLQKVDLWTEITDAEFIRATVIWHLQQIFAMSPAKETIGFTSNKDNSSIHIHATFTGKPHYPEIIISPPQCEMYRLGIGDFGRAMEETETGYNLNYTSRRIYTLTLTAYASERKVLEEIMLLSQIAFQARPYREAYTRVTSVWIDVSSPLTHSAARAIPLSGDEHGDKMYTSSMDISFIQDGGITFMSDAAVIEDIVASIRSEE